MKTVYFLACLALGLAGCTTAIDRAPNPGGWGEYGFTYDLNASPSPFVDTSYRPLTPSDLGAPLLIIVTNQAPPHIVYQTAPEIGVTKYAGEAPISAYNATYPQFYEAAGANRATAGAGATGQPGTAAAGNPGGYYYGGDGGTVIGPITNINQVVTNTPGTNGTNISGIITNGTNAIIVVVTNTNGFGMRTNFFMTNNFAHGTNRFLNEPAGARGGTNANVPQLAPQELTPAEQRNLTPQQQQQLEQFRAQQQLQQQQQLQRQQEIQRLQPQGATPPANINAPNSSVPTGIPSQFVNPTVPGQIAAPATAAPNAVGTGNSPAQSAPANNSSGAATGGSGGNSGGGGAHHSSGNSGGGTSR